MPAFGKKLSKQSRSRLVKEDVRGVQRGEELRPQPHPQRRRAGLHCHRGDHALPRDRRLRVVPRRRAALFPADGARLSDRSRRASSTSGRGSSARGRRRRRRSRSVDTLAVRSHLASLHRAGSANRSIARHLSTLRSFFRWACREGHLEKNPARGPAVARACRGRCRGR